MSRSHRSVSMPLALLAAGACCLTLAGPASAKGRDRDRDKDAEPVAVAPVRSGPHLKSRIAVDQGKYEQLTGEYWYNESQNGFRSIQALIVKKLNESDRFVAYEREATARRQASDEDEIAARKREDVGAKTGVALPAREQRTPADYIITPEIISAGETSHGRKGINLRRFGGIGVGGGKSTYTVKINLRVSDAQTSEIVATADGQGDSKSGGVAWSAHPGPLDLSSDNDKRSPGGTALDASIQDAVEKLVEQFNKSADLWTARIADIPANTGRIVINAGRALGVEPGIRFEVWRAGGTIRDPETGDVISKGDEVRVGAIQVQRVENKASYCDIVSGKGFAVGDMVHLPK